MNDEVRCNGLYKKKLSGRAEALTYTEIDFAGFEPVHVDGFHAYLVALLWTNLEKRDVGAQADKRC